MSGTIPDNHYPMRLSHEKVTATVLVVIIYAVVLLIGHITGLARPSIRLSVPFGRLTGKQKGVGKKKFPGQE